MKAVWIIQSEKRKLIQMLVKSVRWRVVSVKTTECLFLIEVCMDHCAQVKGTSWLQRTLMNQTRVEINSVEIHFCNTTQKGTNKVFDWYKNMSILHFALLDDLNSWRMILTAGTYYWKIIALHWQDLDLIILLNMCLMWKRYFYLETWFRCLFTT